MASAPEPHHYSTLHEALLQVGSNNPGRGFVFQDNRGQERRLSFPELSDECLRRAAAMQALGLRAGDRVALIIASPEEFVLTFLACLRMGAVPVPLYPPIHLGNLEGYLEQTARIIASAQAALVIIAPELGRIAWSFTAKIPSVRAIVKSTDLVGAGATIDEPRVRPDDVAFLQYTSGSTGIPKGVRVTHGALVDNIRAFMGAGLAMDPEVDSGCGWVPLYHDMGLIGFVLGPMYWGVSVVFIPTVRYLKRPNCWFDTIAAHRSTVSFAPAFAYSIALRSATPEHLERWDLSCVKALGCGAEPIPAGAITRFVETFGSHCGLRESALLPAYGLAEATVATTMKPLTERFRERMVNRKELHATGRAHEVSEDGPDVERHVSCGRVLPGQELRIVDDDGHDLPDTAQGQVLIHGVSVCPRYEEEQVEFPVDSSGWLHTGDQGYLHEGHLYITGRIKDMIIIRGRNIPAASIEWEVNKIEGVRTGNACALGVMTDEGETLVVLAETHLEDTTELDAEIHRTVLHVCGTPVDALVLLPPGTLPKTSSGKLQRAKARRQYVEGRLGREGTRTSGDLVDRVRLGARVIHSGWRRLLKSGGRGP
ncbi:fatty acyl-AMP ligase [Paraliomyxa miuraensis]|uniref:fatty acyl-AMP ligase n=1 Tax=Paraliomyxa miuraensis TaxID=376150 RepID=UPI00224ECF1E|nr:fatty acyl-AMP ligase [Paraliomyxa miuraensis]MCX4242999.1 fatty acyl-AMP ligase [Paraliomyxa miuraensis]